MEQIAPTQWERRPLRRPLDGRVVAGVAAGLADYLDVDVVVVRVVLVALTLMGGLAVPLYVAGWLLMPDEGANDSIVEHLIGSVGPPAPGWAPCAPSPTPAASASASAHEHPGKGGSGDVDAA
ncbi:MAG: PspC domain-containing protein [Acidimicrobiales bacterium]